MNPADREAIGDALAEATEAGITVVAVDQAVTEESAFVLSNDQEQYAYLGATWLFEKMGGRRRRGVHARDRRERPRTTIATRASSERWKRTRIST